MSLQMAQVSKSSGPVKKALAGWAKKTGLQHNLKALEAREDDAPAAGYSYPIAKKLVFSKVKQTLGFDRCRIIGVGAAPMSLPYLEYFLSLDIPIFECYGMSETSGPNCGNRNGHHK